MSTVTDPGIETDRGIYIGDFRNDISRPIVKGLSSIVFTIYDANNNIVFTTTQLSAPDPHGLAIVVPWIL